VPRELTAEHKRKRVEICQRLLNRYKNEGKEFLSRIVTGDETWVHHYEPESTEKCITRSLIFYGQRCAGSGA